MAQGPISRRRQPRQWQRVYPTAPDGAWMLGGALALAIEARRDRHLAAEDRLAAELAGEDCRDGDGDHRTDHGRAEDIADSDDIGDSDCDATDAGDWP